MSRISFDDTPYSCSHGKAPRGRGSWGFADVNEQHDIDHAQFFYGTFADARRQAARHFAQQPDCSGVVVVLP